MPPLNPGDAAPDIEARNQHGERISPDFSRETVVYFYCEDGDPECRTQNEQFALAAEIYEEAGVMLYGVSTDDVESHREFATEVGVGYDLLADPEQTVCDAFDVECDEGDRAERTTFALGGSEVLVTYEDVTPDGHAHEVIRELHERDIVNL